MAYTESIDTPWGRLLIHLPTPERVHVVADVWPFELGRFSDPDDRDNARAEFRLPLESPRGALPGVFMAHLPGPQTDALARVAATRRILARSLGALVGRQAGVTLLCATLREEGDGVATSGVGLFVLPAGPDRRRAPGDELEAGFDARLGPGSGALVGDALRALSGVDHPPTPPVTGLKLAAAPYMGKRWLDFMVVGGQVVCLMDQVDPSEPVWSDLADGGVREVVHMPVGGATPQLGLPQAVPEGQGALSAGGARRVYRLLCHIAAVDGTIDPRERVVLDDYCDRLGIRREDAGRLMQEGVRGTAIEVGPSRLERALLLEGLLDVAAADGVLAAEEEAMLVEFAELVGLSLAELHHALRTRFEALEQASRGRLDAGAADAGDADRADATQDEAPDGESLRRVYRLLWNLAACDGDVDPLEEAFLEAFRQQHGIGEEEANALAAQGQRGEALRIGRTFAERKLLVESLIALAAADGVLAPQEERKLSELAVSLGIPQPLIAKALAERFPAEQLEELEQADAVPADETGTVLLLDLPVDVLGVDLLKAELEPGFLGFRGVPAGVHRFAVPSGPMTQARWVRLAAGDVLVLAWDGRRLVPADATRSARYRELVKGEGLGDALVRFPYDVPWELLTAPLLDASFPPQLHPVTGDPAPERFEQAWLHTHRGNLRALLAELAYAFLTGVLGDANGAMQRWTHLVQGIYHVGPELPRRDPGAFVALVDLLIAQQQLLPRELLCGDSAVVVGAREFAQTLAATDARELVEAGGRFAVFCAANHRPHERKQTGRIESPTETLEAELAGLQAEDADEARQLELGLLVAELQERRGDLQRAYATRASLLALAERQGASALDLARGYQRLGRLAISLGDREAAEQAAVRVRELLRSSSGRY